MKFQFGLNKFVDKYGILTQTSFYIFKNLFTAHNNKIKPQFEIPVN